MIALRPYQTRAVAALCGHSRAIVQAPAGSGKTIIGAAALARWVVEAPAFCPTIVWLANTMEQCQQARAAIALFPELNDGFCDVTIRCYASGLNCAGADLVVLDECHHVAAPCIRQCLDGHAGVRWGLSATPQRADDLAQDVYDLIGPIVCVIDRAELVESGQLARAVVQFHAPNTWLEAEAEISRVAEPLIQQRKKFWRKLPESEIRSRTTWQVCQQLGLFENGKRNAYIRELIRQNWGKSMLVLVGSIEHGESFKDRLGDGAIVAHSGMGTRTRKAAMDAFRARELRCLIATSLADEGLDLPCAEVLILTSGGRSAAKAEQRTGRVLRTWGDKTHGTIHDFWDHQHYFLRAQSVARARTYQQLGYEIRMPEGVSLEVSKTRYKVAA